MDYGVPQNRKRVFIFGIHEDLDSSTIEFPPKPTHHSPGLGKKPCWIPASSVFEAIPSDIKKDTLMNISLVNAIFPKNRHITF